MAKKAITEEQLRAANKAGYSTQQIAGEINKYEKRTGNDAVYSGALPNGQVANQGLAPTPQVAPPVQTQPIVQTPNANMIDTSTGKPVSESPENAQYNILPENVTGVKPNVGQPVISPALQAKMDARKAGLDTMNNQAKTDVQKSMDEKNALSDKKENAFNFYLKNSGQSEEQLKETLKSAGYTDEEIADKLKGIANSTKPEYNAVGPNGEVRAAIDPATGKPVETSDLEKQAQATGVEYTMQNGQATYNPKTTEEAAKILAMGGKLAGETKMSAVAQASLNKVRGLGQMTDQQLANNIAGGQVSNKELELLNTMNPQLVAQAKELSKKKIITNTTNEIQADNSAIIRGEEPTGMSKPLQDLVNKLATIDADTKSPAEMKTAYQDAHPEMIQSRDQINALTTQKRDLQLAKMNLWKEWKEKNSSYPISMIMAGYSAATRDLDNSIYLINDDLNTEISNYNMYLDDMNAEIDFEIGQQGKEEQRLWDIYGVTSKEQIRNEDIQREDARIEQSIQLEEARYQRDIERDDMKSAEARKQKIEDLKMQQNMTIEDGLLSLGVDPTGMTPEEMRATYAQATGNQIAYDNALAAAKLAPGTTGTSNGLSGNVSVGDLASYSMDKRGRQNLQCGELANDSWEKMTGTPLLAGNSYDSKLKAIQKVGQSSGPVAGGVFAFPVETFAGNTGHIGIVKSVNSDGSITVLEANRKENSPNGGVPTEGTYTAGQVKNMVFSVSGGNPNAGKYTDSDIELLSELANMDASARNTALKAQGIPLSSVTEYMALAKSGKIPPSESQKQSSAQIMSQIQDLVSTDWNDATGFQINPFFSIGGTDRATAEGKIASLIAAITLPNLGMLKGPMSDKDLAFIQNASTRLNTKQSDKEFEKQLIELYNIGARKNGMKEITKLSDMPKDRIMAGQNQPTPTGNTGTTAPTPPVGGGQVVNGAI